MNYAWLSGSTWYTDIVVGGGLTLTTNQALSFSTFDKPGIAAFDGSALTPKYIYKSAGAWNITDIPIDTPAGAGMSSAQTAGGAVRIACYSDFGLAYASRQSDTWNPVLIDDSGWTGLYTSIALDSENFAHISYYDAANKRLMYVRYIDP